MCGEGHTSVGGHAAFPGRSADLGRCRAGQCRLFLRDEDRAHQRGAAHHYPFSEEAWQALDALGDRVDADLVGQDVRLTMGGEPTFVSIDDYQSAEWNTAAVGPTKRGLADQLIRRLRDRFAPGGLLHCGQGKWYPGEELPRWAFSLLWRTDGKPIWHDAALIARKLGGAEPSAQTTRTVHRSAREPARHNRKHVLPAFEDPADRMLKEGALPPNIDPSDPKIADPIERARIMREFERHSARPSDMCFRCSAGPRGQTRAGSASCGSSGVARLFLIPGDSPIGFRLPLSSLPYLSPADEPRLVPADPFEERDALADPSEMAEGCG